MTATLAPRKSSGWTPLREPCPVCGHRGHCTRTADGQVVKCMRNPNDHPVKQKDGAVGYLYRADAITGGNLPKSSPAPKPPTRTTSEWRNIIKQHQTAVNPKRLSAFAESLGLSVDSLKAYGVGLDVGGYDGKVGTGWWSFPMFDEDMKPIGIRLRQGQGGDGKKSVLGSRNGLFIPVGYDPRDEIPEGICSDQSMLLLLLPEGPTSSAAAWQLGFKRTIGRPNNSLGGEMVRKLLRTGKPQDVVIVADHEDTKWRKGDPASKHADKETVPYWPGWEGALRFADELIYAPVKHLRIVKVKDADGNKVKDLRKFLQGGGHANVVNQVIARAEDVTKELLAAKLAEVAQWRDGLTKRRVDELEAAPKA
jgi:hypothetical protein